MDEAQKGKQPARDQHAEIDQLWKDIDEQLQRMKESFVQQGGIAAEVSAPIYEQIRNLHALMGVLDQRIRRLEDHTGISRERAQRSVRTSVHKEPPGPL